MLQCPVCRARFRGNRICSRCGADLGAVMWIAAHAWRLRSEAREALASGDWERAASLAAEAYEQQSTPEGEALRRVSEWMARHG